MFGDPDYAHHKAIGELWSRVAMALATTPLIPYDPTDYTDVLKNMFNELVKVNGDALKEHSISLGK